MKNPDRAKIMELLDSRPMVEHVTQLALSLQTQRVLIVVGHQKQQVVKHLSSLFPTVEFVDQLEQLGTGHAVMQTDGAFRSFDGSLLVLSGDVPLLTKRTVERLLRTHWQFRSKATVLTAHLANPGGYGRIVRNADGTLRKIVEEKDSDFETRQIQEINSGIYVFEKGELFEALRFIRPENTKLEYYLTDVFEYFSNRGWKTAALKADQPEETSGVNSAEELEYVRKLSQPRS